MHWKFSLIRKLTKRIEKSRQIKKLIILLLYFLSRDLNFQIKDFTNSFGAEFFLLLTESVIFPRLV